MSLVVALKITALQRCVARAREIYALAGTGFRTDQNLQDAAILNVIRACETAIDLANMAMRHKKIGIPTATREYFSLLEREGVITPELAQSLRAMVGFRNLVVHQYQSVNLDVVESLIERGLDDLLAFAEEIRKYTAPAQEVP